MPRIRQYEEKYQREDFCKAIAHAQVDAGVRTAKELAQAVEVTDKEVEDYYDVNASTIQSNYGISKVDKKLQPHYRKMRSLYALKDVGDGKAMTVEERDAALKEKIRRRYEEAQQHGRNPS